MNVAPDQTIIFGLQILLDNRSMSSIHKQISMLLVCKRFVKVLMFLPFFTIVSLFSLVFLSLLKQHVLNEDSSYLLGSKVVKLQACVLLPSKGLVKILMFLPLFSRLSAFPPRRT